MITENKAFFALYEVLELLNKGKNDDAQKYVISAMSKLPSNLKIFVVSQGNGKDEIICQTRKMAEDIYRNNLDFKEIYYFNPKGDCTQIKSRK